MLIWFCSLKFSNFLLIVNNYTVLRLYTDIKTKICMALMFR